jgi:hypothetical protein
MLPDRQLAAQPVKRLRVVSHGTGDQVRWKQANADVLRSVQHNGIDATEAEAPGHLPHCRYGPRREC